MKSSVFIDSNVWFSAFYKEGSCSKLLRIDAAPNSIRWSIYTIVIKSAII